MRPFDAPSHVITFDLPLAHLLEFRSADAKLKERAVGALRVVTFALGGVSTLARLSMAEFESLARILSATESPRLIWFGRSITCSPD